MKITKKKVFVAALAVCLIAILSMGSLAWFSAQDSVTNNFYVADSTDPDPDDIFSVEVFERVDTDGDGNIDAALFENGFNYKDILPGDKLVKEPVVRNTGYYDQYVRVTVTISDAEAWINALGANFDVTKVFVGFDASQWVHVWNNLYGATEVPEDIVYVLYYKDILESGKDIPVFTHIQIPESLTQEQAAEFEGGFTIDIKAQAVQTENVGAENVADIDKAWTAFNTVMSGNQ